MLFPACLCLFICIFMVVIDFQMRRMQEIKRRLLLGEASQVSSAADMLVVSNSLYRWVLVRLIAYSGQKAERNISKTVQGIFTPLALKVNELLPEVSCTGWSYLRVCIEIFLRAGVFCLVLGALCGNLLGLMGLILGFVVSLYIPVKAAKIEQNERLKLVEYELPECIDLLILCLQSGMNFDRSIDTYCTYENGLLSRLFRVSYERWSSGFCTRQEALCVLSQTYASPLFQRLVQTISRSLKFGTELSLQLESLNLEARKLKRLQVEERIAKLPVKMMIPIGTLILPAMLLLVVGPILLEMGKGL